MSENFTTFIRMVIANNPIAISQKMVTLGYMERYSDDSETVRQTLFDTIKKKEDAGKKGEAQTLLLRVLDVALNPQGNNAVELRNWYNERANRSLLQSYLHEATSNTQTSNNIFSPFSGENGQSLIRLVISDKVIRIGVIVVLGLAAVLLIKKLFD